MSAIRLTMATNQTTSPAAALGDQQLQPVLGGPAGPDEPFRVGDQLPGAAGAGLQQQTQLRGGELGDLRSVRTPALHPHMAGADPVALGGNLSAHSAASSDSRHSCSTTARRQPETTAANPASSSAPTPTNRT
jgi:hypothetical protein